jgi:hypothetical protein
LYRRPVAADSANGGEGVTATMDAIALLAVGALGLVAGRIARAVVPWPGALGVVGTAARRGGGEQHRLHAAGRLHRVNAGVVVVQAGDAILVRSIRGRRGGWYRRLRANPDGEAGDRAHIYPVRARPVQDAATVEAVTGAYAAKDGDSP